METLVRAQSTPQTPDTTNQNASAIGDGDSICPSSVITGANVKNTPRKKRRDALGERVNHVFWEVFWTVVKGGIMAAQADGRNYLERMALQRPPPLRAGAGPGRSAGLSGQISRLLPDSASRVGGPLR